METVTKYLQVLGRNMRISWVCACVCVHGLWSNPCHSITLPLISACELYLGAKPVTCLRAVQECRRLCGHMEAECNGCQTSREWADANKETGRTRARTIGITITLFIKYILIWQGWFWVSQRILIQNRECCTLETKYHSIIIWLLRVWKGEWDKG